MNDNTNINDRVARLEEIQKKHLYRDLIARMVLDTENLSTLKLVYEILSKLS